MKKIIKTEQEWRELLTQDEYQICREKGTERAFTRQYYDCHSNGIYRCKCCGETLFDSETKYDSGSGWPSFYQPFSKEAVLESRDSTHGMTRVEVMCNYCESHLGHVFEDGPAPTGLRYCINSVSLTLDEETLEEKSS